MMRIAKPGAPPWAALMLAGCASVPTPSPSAWEGHREPSPSRRGPGRMAAHVRVPDPANGRPVSLAEVLAYADTHAPEMRIAEARMAEAEVAHALAGPRVPANPTLRLGVGPRITEAGTGVDVRASLSQPFEVGGERRFRRVLAHALTHRLEAEAASVRWSVHERVHHAFHDALAARERLAAAGRVATFEGRMVHIAERRLSAGDISPLTLELAKSEEARAEQRRLAAEMEYASMRLKLAETAGWPIAHPPEPAGELDAPREPPPLTELLDLAEAHHPVLHALESAVEEATISVGLADRERWPEPALGIDYAREEAEGEAPEHVVVAGLTLALPLFQRNGAARAEARAALEGKKAALDAYRFRLAARIARGVTEVSIAASRVRLFGTNILPTLETHLERLEHAHELGEIDLITASVAMERFLRAQDDALDAYGDYHEALASLEAAVGADLFADERHAVKP